MAFLPSICGRFRALFMVLPFAGTIKGLLTRATGVFPLAAPSGFPNAGQACGRKR
jgi:hypothetical protein